MKLDSLVYDYEDAGRPEILEAVSAAMRRYLKGEKCTGLQLAPRVGKQSIAVLFANEARAQNVPFVHIIVPWTSLSHQIVDAKKNKRTFDFYKAYGTNEPFRADIVETIPHHKYYTSYTNRPTLFASTVQLLLHNINVIVKSVEYAIQTTGMRPVFIIDEVQLMGAGLPWYEMIEKLIGAGAYIISMTGTERRSDKKNIIGFEFREVEGSKKDPSAHKILKGVRTEDNGDKIASIALGTLSSVEYEIIPTGSTPVPIAMAFDRGWCEGMDVKTFDFQFVDLASGEQFLVSQASLEKTRPNLTDWLQSDECIRMAVQHVIGDLIRRRISLNLKDAKAMFITLSDMDSVKKKKNKHTDEGANYHARKIRNEFKRQFSLLPQSIRSKLGRVNAEICTSMLSNGEPDNAAMVKLKRFTLTEMDDDGNEPIDVLFVKNMGVVGLDVPQLKTMANLCSNSADAPTTIQANLRIVTKWEESSVNALLILPAHYHSLQFRDMCGKWSNKIQVSTFEEDSDYEKVIIEKEIEDCPVIDGSGKVHSYSTHNGDIIETDLETTLAAVCRKYKIANTLSHYQLIESIEEGAFPLTDEDFKETLQDKYDNVSSSGVEVIDVNDERNKIEKNNESFGVKANRLAGQVVRYNDDPKEWLRINKQLIAKAKSKCNISRYQSKQEIVDPEVLSQLMNALDDAYADIKEEQDRYQKQRRLVTEYYAEAA
jgi:hypothetical protein